MAQSTEHRVIFLLNGSKQIINENLDPNTSLNDFIRNHAKLKGTKAMCHEGGCGACVVSVQADHPVSKEKMIFSVNSCLVSVFSCHGWSITTIEGLGDRKGGYHAIQKRLAAFNGTQCGFCSPGWIMNMYSIWEGAGRILTMKETENSFASNICRCTGYRPILDAFKSLTSDCDKEILDRIQDIEDMSGISMCTKTGQLCTKTCDDYEDESGYCIIGMEQTLGDDKQVIELNLDGVKWFKVYTTEQAFGVLEEKGSDSYRFVAGNTAQGVYHTTQLPAVMIDISGIEELKSHSKNSNLVIGGGMTLNEIMKLFRDVATTDEYYFYLRQFYDHLDLVAHIPVRNIGTIAGNLMIKHENRDFPSDVFLLLETVGAVVTLLSKGGTKTEVTLPQFLKADMRGKIILNIKLPPLACECVVQTYKIMPRAQNAHAHVNAGFLLKFNTDRTTVEKATIVYGNINPDFIHATATEKYVQGKNVFDADVLKGLIESLDSELLPVNAPPEPSPEFRKKLAIGLFYKFILHIAPGVNDRLKTGGDEFKRPVSSGVQKYDTNKAVWPLNQPVPKLESLVQCSGEGTFVNDLPHQHNEVFVAFVLSTVFKGTIQKIDATDALKVKGVLAFFTAKDIPGTNIFTPLNSGNTAEEEILADGKVKYHGQPVGIIVADKEKLANKAAKMVKVEYKDVPPTAVLSIKDALAAPKAENRVVNNSILEPTADKGKDVKKVIKGNFEIFSQYHYTMETQICICIPIEDGMDVYSSTQSMDMVQIAIANTLKLPQNRINVAVRRLGGGYGSKISRSTLIACGCALAAHLLNRPARMVMSLMDNMAAIGKRMPCKSNYEVGVNNQGEIQYLRNIFYQDNGCSHNESPAPDSANHSLGCYETSKWYISANSVLTDLPSNTWCRAPGTTEGSAMTENIMEHIAYELGLDPVAVRLANMDKTDNNLSELINQIKADAEYDRRVADIVEFNKCNRWKKKGISLVPLRYRMIISGYYHSLVSIFQGDGTVSVSHGGIEMGQGLNTKVAQVCAHILGIPLSNISIKPSNTHMAPNATTTGGSAGSELCCFATMKACQILLDRLEPIRKDMKNPTWEELIIKAYADGVTLSATYTFSSQDKVLKNYYIYGVSIAEVEVDMLTGNHLISRVDILEDTGESLSPQIDVGQVEGAFIMGIGYWTSENLIHNKSSGELLTNRTWNYKPPGIKDIPLDFRVQFRRNAGNPVGVLRSKATGEPALNMTISVAHAIRQAIASARKDSGLENDAWCKINTPYTTENILLAANTNVEDFKLK